MFQNIMLLMRDAFEDNKIGQERFYVSLEKFFSVPEQLDEIKMRDRLLELTLIKEMASGGEELIFMLELSAALHKKDEENQ